MSSQKEYVGFWPRFVASVLDGTLLTIVGVLLTMAAVYSISALKSAFEVGGKQTAFYVQFASVGIYFLVSIFYYTIGHAVWGTTLGKKFLGVYVIDEKTGEKLSFLKSFVRCLGYGVSSITLGIGYLFVFFNPEKKHFTITSWAQFRSKSKLFLFPDEVNHSLGQRNPHCVCFS